MPTGIVIEIAAFEDGHALKIIGNGTSNRQAKKEQNTEQRRKVKLSMLNYERGKSKLGFIRSRYNKSKVKSNIFNLLSFMPAIFAFNSQA